MRVKVAKRAGFCMGVRLAVDKVLEAPNKHPKPIYTFGPVIHNPQIMALLQEKGITELNDIPEQGSGTVLIRAHGVPPATKRSLSEAGFHILDATCPRVAKVQQIIHRHVAEDAAAIILGDSEHPEVVGLRGFAGERGYVVSNLEELMQLPWFDNAVVVQQTTQSTPLYRNCLDWLAENRPHYRVYNTLCDSTTMRQSEVQELAPQVDAMIVVGGHESGNTKRLAEISRQSGLVTHHIETERELPASFPEGTETVAVTAGASTPNWIIRNIHRKLERLPTKRRYVLSEGSLRLQRFLLLSNIWVALGAAGLCHGFAALLNVPATLLPPLIAFLYVHSMHTLNNLTGDRTDKYTDPERNEFYASQKYPLWLGTTATGAGAVASAYLLSWVAFLVIIAMSLLGLSYNFRIIPWGLCSQPLIKIRDIPGSKTVVITMAWAIAAALVPTLTPGYTSGTWLVAVFLLAMALIFVRTAFFDILDMQGDRILGRETLPLLLGEKRTLRILKAILVIAAIGLFAASATFASVLLAAYVLCPVSLYAVLAAYERQQMLSHVWLEFLVESHFLYLGLTALLIFTLDLI
ncbi:MAG: 4-hydroxy-3-methylbut-2-enyl diphosphate reductase [Desulfohalobiaceae bacterium]